MKAKNIIIYADVGGTACIGWGMDPVAPERSLRLIQHCAAEGGFAAAA